MADPTMLHPSIFREYDIRGVVGDTLTVDGVRAIGTAFAHRLTAAGGRRVAVGRDGRLTSPELEAALVDGLTRGGADVVRVGLGPTPMLYFATKHLDADGGMMITGSHNPSDYNGIKMTFMGRPFFGSDIQALAQAAAVAEPAGQTGRVEEQPVAEAYVDRLCQDFRGAPALSIAWDPGNGAAAAVLPLLCERLSCRHVAINDVVDGRFPAHHPDPTVEENLEQLKALVAAEKSDLGIAFDGDGDRIGVVDSLGRVLWGDQLLLILAREVLAECPGATIIADVKTSQVFFDEIRRLGGNPIMSRTGHSLIKTLMAETGAPLAGEMSGHIFFAHRYYGYDDALYAAVRLLAILARSSDSLARLRDAMPAVVNTPELRIDCPDDRKFVVIENVRTRLASEDGISVNDVDGVRVSSDGGWWLLRASNTQPVLVGRCEAKDQATLNRQIDQLTVQLRASGIEPPTLV